MRDVEFAGELAKDVINMCKAGRFHIQKVQFKKQGVTAINLRELEKNWCQGLRSIRLTSKGKVIGNWLRN